MARVLLFFALIITVVGCSNDSGDIAPVSGRVLVDGEPKAGLVVMFQPIGSTDNPNPGYGSAGLTDADGRFTLALANDPDTEGAVVGKHRVAIFTADPAAGQKTGNEEEVGSPDGAPPPPKETIPLKYNDETGLTFDVPADGTDQANFDIESINPKGPKR